MKVVHCFEMVQLAEISRGFGDPSAVVIEVLGKGGGFGFDLAIDTIQPLLDGKTVVGRGVGKLGEPISVTCSFMAPENTLLVQHKYEHDGVERSLITHLNFGTFALPVVLQQLCRDEFNQCIGKDAPNANVTPHRS